MNKVTALIILLIGLLQYKLWFGDGNVLEFQRLNDRIAELRQEGAKRRERNTALEAEVMDLKQGLDAVEERARHELGMVMEGEQFVQVIDPQHEPEPTVSPAPEKPAFTDELPEGAKGSKKENSQQKKKTKDTPKSTESQPPSAKKPATATNKTPPKPKPVPRQANPKSSPKAVKAERPPAPEQQPLFDEANQ